MASYKMGWKFEDTEYKINNLGIDNIYIDEKEDDLEYDIYKKYKDYFPEIVDQGNIESCVPTCISTIYYYLTMKQMNHLKFRISRLYLYYQVRKLYNDIENDNGSTISDCINILHTDGIIPEFLYPYIPNNVHNNPNVFLDKYSKFCKCLGFENINRNHIKQKILQDYPVLCGIKLFNSIYNDDVKKTGIINKYDKNDELLGGHCIIIIGFDDTTKYYKFINSWGTSWGNNGFGFLPYEFINNNKLSNEFYILKEVSNPLIQLEEEGIIKKVKNKFKNLFS